MPAKPAAVLRLKPLALLALLGGCMVLAGPSLRPAHDVPPGGAHVLTAGDLRVEIEVATDRLAAEFGPRFDRTAVVRSVTVGGVELLGPWGLSDEFGLYGDGVLGYPEAAVGGTFLKVGVGRLVRDTEARYHFAHPYPVDMLFPIEVDADERSLTVAQRSAGEGAWHYEYRKSYALSEADELEIRYELTNTGTSAWTFEHYNHHWFRVEGVPVGPGYRVVTGFELPPAETGFDRSPFSLAMPGPLAPGAAEYYASELAGVPVSANRFELQVGGATMVSYQGALSPARFAVYAHADGFCPEVFTRGAVQPGETVGWAATYHFDKPR